MFVATRAVEGHDAAPNRQAALLAMVWVLASVATVSVVLRVLFRSRAKVCGWADVFMVIAMQCFIGWSITMTLYGLRGGTRHIWDLEPLGVENLVKTRMLNWAGQVMVILGVAAGKVSVSALLLSILRHTHHQWQKTYLWAVTIGLTLLVAVSCSVLTIAQCSPPRKLWDHRVEGRCIDPEVMAGYGMFTSSFNTFADASLAVIPATIFWSLRSNRLEQTQLSIVFALNILTSLCSGIKTPLLKGLANREDITWATFDVFAWVTAELFLMIICGTLPTLHPVLTLTRAAGWWLRDKLYPAVPAPEGRRSDSKSRRSNTDCELSTLRTARTNMSNKTSHTADTFDTITTLGAESHRQIVVQGGRGHGAHRFASERPGPSSGGSGSWGRWSGAPR